MTTEADIKPRSDQDHSTLFDWEAMETLQGRDFRNADPYPWINPQGLLHEEAYRALTGQHPDLALFRKAGDQYRKHGQRGHSRYTLEWEQGLQLPSAWQQFIDELRSDRYRDWLRRITGHRWLKLHFHWHYAPAGGEVSPHCDSKRKIGSHIFYMNTLDDWRQEWGGETLVLDDGGQFDKSSAPEFEEFRAIYPAQTLENYSFLFMRRGNSWHGVKAVECPEGQLRKVFIVVIYNGSPWRRLRRLLKGKAGDGV
jgi:hypothetical protein